MSKRWTSFVGFRVLERIDTSKGCLDGWGFTSSSRIAVRVLQLGWLGGQQKKLIVGEESPKKKVSSLI